MRKRLTLLGLLIVFLIMGMVCESSGEGGPSSNAQIIHVVASTNLSSWLDQSVEEYNKLREKSPDGRPYYIEVIYKDAGQAVTDFDVDEIQEVDLWIPDNITWADLLVEQGISAFQENCKSTAESPLVIAMWQELAEALGWPSRKLGWLDIGSLAADPSAWEYYSGGQYGATFRLGHAHPGLSAAGTNTLLAVVQSAQAQQEAVRVSDIQEPIVQASVTAFESSVSTFSGSSYELGQLMEERGDSYLNAAVMYENSVAEFQQQGVDIVPIYPFEGTFIADFPACVNTVVSGDGAAGAEAFRAFLLSEDGQLLAAKNGLRPVNEFGENEVLDIQGFDFTKPEIVFANPVVETIFAVQELWQSSRKPLNLVMILDTSASMRGEKMESVKNAAVEFVAAMGDEDFLTIVYYDVSDKVVPLVYHAKIETERESIIQAIGQLTVQSSTPLYDSIGVSAQIIADTHSSQMSNAMVVLTDGNDTASTMFSFDQNLIQIAIGYETGIYTIAFGNDADEDILEQLAMQANGNFYLADQANIAEIYSEMSVLFGGNAGIGR